MRKVTCLQKGAAHGMSVAAEGTCFDCEVCEVCPGRAGTGKGLAAQARSMGGAAWALGLVLAAACVGAARAQQLQPGSYPAVDPALYAPPQVVGAPTGAFPAALQDQPLSAQAVGAHTRCPYNCPCSQPCVTLALRALLALQV